MCGIVGWFSPDRSIPDVDVLRRMTDAVTHRGPDGSGLHTAEGVGLGHRRLAIVDLSGGAQPMSDRAGDVTVTFNGEIYNHRALRRDLEQRGAAFQTRSDTEVLVHGWAAWGDDLLARLNGMFSFGLWDARSRRGVLARDRLGQKPLYYAHLDDGTLLFSSELKSLLEHPRIDRVADRTALALYLTYEYVPYPYSAIAGVRKLPPGHRLIWEDGEIAIRPFAHLPFGEPCELRSSTEWIAETRRALSRSIERRLMSDVPLGVFLSGGIDSSAVVALMSEHVDPREIRTFSIAFDDPSFDESSYAQTVATHFGTQHRVRSFSADDLLGLLPDVVSWSDEPFGDASLLPTHLLSRFTREHVTVALGGDGGDELFLGYETFRADTAARAYRLLPEAMRRVIASGVQQLPVDQSNFSFDFVAKYFVRGADADGVRRHVRWLASFLPGHADDPLQPEIRSSIPDELVYGVMEDPYRRCPDPDHRQRLSYAYLSTYFPEDILTKVDRASMATSLEARTPFVDPELVSLVARMPSSLKLRLGFDAKYALKKAVEQDLPREILERKKKGFGVPIARWLNGPLADEVDRLLAPGRIRAAGLLRADVVERLLGEHRRLKRDNRKQLWTLFMLEKWREQFDVRL